MVSRWSCQRVFDWVAQQEFPEEVLDVLRTNHIDGEILMSLSESDMDQLGVHEFRWRRKLSLRISGLKTKPIKSDVKAEADAVRIEDEGAADSSADQMGSCKVKVEHLTEKNVVRATASHSLPVKSMEGSHIPPAKSTDAGDHRVKSTDAKDHRVKSTDGEDHRVKSTDGEDRLVKSTDGEGRQVKSMDGNRTPKSNRSASLSFDGLPSTPKHDVQKSDTAPIAKTPPKSRREDPPCSLEAEKPNVNSRTLTEQHITLDVEKSSDSCATKPSATHSCGDSILPGVKPCKDAKRLVPIGKALTKKQHFVGINRNKSDISPVLPNTILPKRPELAKSTKGIVSPRLKSPLGSDAKPKASNMPSAVPVEVTPIVKAAPTNHKSPSEKGSLKSVGSTASMFKEGEIPDKLSCPATDGKGLELNARDDIDMFAPKSCPKASARVSIPRKLTLHPKAKPTERNAAIQTHGATCAPAPSRPTFKFTREAMDQATKHVTAVEKMATVLKTRFDNFLMINCAGAKVDIGERLKHDTQKAYDDIQKLKLRLFSQDRDLSIYLKENDALPQSDNELNEVSSWRGMLSTLQARLVEIKNNFEPVLLGTKEKLAKCLEERGPLVDLRPFLTQHELLDCPHVQVLLNHAPETIVQSLPSLFKANPDDIQGVDVQVLSFVRAQLKQETKSFLQKHGLSNHDVLEEAALLTICVVIQEFNPWSPQAPSRTNFLDTAGLLSKYVDGAARRYDSGAYKISSFSRCNGGRTIHPLAAKKIDQWQFEEVCVRLILQLHPDAQERIIRDFMLSCSNSATGTENLMFKRFFTQRVCPSKGKNMKKPSPHGEKWDSAAVASRAQQRRGQKREYGDDNSLVSDPDKRRHTGDSRPANRANSRRRERSRGYAENSRRAIPMRGTHRTPAPRDTGVRLKPNRETTRRDSKGYNGKVERQFRPKQPGQWWVDSGSNPGRRQRSPRSSESRKKTKANERTSKPTCIEAHGFMGELKSVNGKYSLDTKEDHFGKPIYRKIGPIQTCCFYWWDDRDGEAMKGWWLSPSVGCDDVWAHSSLNDPMPPKVGWKCPWNATNCDLRISVNPV